MKIGSIQVKIAVWSGLCLLVTAGIIILLSVHTVQKNALITAEEQGLSLAEENEAHIRAEIEGALFTARALSQMFSSDNALSLDRKNANAILKSILEKNPQFVGVYTLWEPNAFDGLDAQYVNKPGHDKTGRFIPYWCRNETGSIIVEPLVNYEKEGAGDYYILPKKRGNECILDPYVYPVQGKEVLITSLVAPIMVNGVFRGIVGVDIKIDFLQKLADEVDIFDKTGKLILISNNGTLVAVTGHPDFVGKPAKTVYSDFGSRNLQSVIQNGEKIVRFDSTQLDIMEPMSFGMTNTPWSAKVVIPRKTITRDASIMSRNLIFTSLGLTVIALLFLYLLSARIARPITKTIVITGEIAHGNLVEAKKHVDMLTPEMSDSPRTEEDGTSKKAFMKDDEAEQLLSSVKTMTGNLISLVSQVQRSVIQVTSSTTEIAGTARQLEATVTEQASSTNEVVATTKEISSTSRELENTMNAVNSFALETSSLADEGKNDLAKMEATISRLNEATGSISTKLSVIRKKAENINQVIAVIGKISHQTNLLSLNAAIEAEKAGEYGLGFSVVAREIRRLSDQTSLSTYEIEQMVKEMQTAVSSGVMEMDKFTSEIKQGVSKVGQIGSQLEKIIKQVAMLIPRFAEVNDGMRMQSQSARQISEAMIQLGETTQQTSESIHDFNCAVDQLNDASRCLQNEMAGFKVGRA